MNFTSLQNALIAFNKTIHATIPGKGRAPYSGESQVVVNGVHPDLNLNPSSSKSPGCVFLATIDGCSAFSATLGNENLPVVLAVGANYGQGADYLRPWNLPASEIVHCTGMYDNAKEALVLAGLQQQDGLQQLDFVLVVFNVIPWITPNSWGKYSASDQSSLMAAHGFANPLKVIQDISAIINPCYVLLHGKDAWHSRLFNPILSGLISSRPAGSKGYITGNLSYPSIGVPIRRW